MLTNLNSASGGSLTGDTLVLVLVVVWVLWRQLRPQRYRPDRLLLWPVLLVVLSVVDFSGGLLSGPHATLLLAASIAFAFFAGVARGLTNQVSRRDDGSIWVVGGWLGVAAYIVTLLFHYGIDAAFGNNNPKVLLLSLPLYLAALLLGRAAGLYVRVQRNIPPGPGELASR